MATLPRVLVVDDDPEMLASVADALSRLGFEVTRASSGGELMDRLVTERPFDLIVSDVSMPWMDGLKTLRSVRTAGLATPVIVMTALREARIADLVSALGPDASLLLKPFGLDDLDAAVTALLPSARPKVGREV